MFIEEDSDGRVTKIKSRYVTFIKDDFPNKGDIDKSHHLYETKEE